VLRYGHYVKVTSQILQLLAPLNACARTRFSIEAAQPNLDPRTLDMLPDKVVMYGVLDLKDHRVRRRRYSPRIRGALRHAAPERLVIAPDCGMKYLPRAVAFAKLRRWWLAAILRCRTKSLRLPSHARRKCAFRNLRARLMVGFQSGGSFQGYTVTSGIRRQRSDIDASR